MEEKFSVGTDDASTKNEIWGGEIPVSQSTFKPFIEKKVYCSQYGVPYEGEMELSIQSNFGFD